MLYSVPTSITVHNTERYYSSGVTFSLRGNDSIPTNGSGCVLITDINPNGDNDEDALICRSGKPISTGGNWYLHPTEMSTNDTDRINPVNDVPDRGWKWDGGFDFKTHLLVRLRRNSTTAEEGVFTCDIPGDANTPRSVGVYYPSELWRIYHVSCVSTTLILQICAESVLN